MKFTVVTLFPQILKPFFESSLMARAVAKGLVEYQLVDLRSFATGNYRSCDDAPYGGGAGQLLSPEPLGRALDSCRARDKGKHVVYLSPGGELFTQKKARQLGGNSELVLICGRYEGIDQRVIDLYVDEEISIGDYVTSSGETAALVLIDAVYRLAEGVIKEESLAEESFEESLLEYPQYTRPRVYKGLEVPAVLTGGNHAEIKKWRLEKSVLKTMRNRPELIARAKAQGSLSADVQKAIDRVTGFEQTKRTKRRKKHSRDGEAQSTAALT